MIMVRCNAVPIVKAEIMTRDAKSAGSHQLANIKPTDSVITLSGLVIIPSVHYTLRDSAFARK